MGALFVMMKINWAARLKTPIYITIEILATIRKSQEAFHHSKGCFSASQENTGQDTGEDSGCGSDSIGTSRWSFFLT
jgi:hypothetical protein